MSSEVPSAVKASGSRMPEATDPGVPLARAVSGAKRAAADRAGERPRTVWLVDPHHERERRERILSMTGGR